MEHNLVIYKAILKRVTTKNRILSTKDTRRLKVSILVVFRMGCLFYFRFLMVQDVLMFFFFFPANFYEITHMETILHNNVICMLLHLYICLMKDTGYRNS